MTDDREYGASVTKSRARAQQDEGELTAHVRDVVEASGLKVSAVRVETKVGAMSIVIECEGESLMEPLPVEMPMADMIEAERQAAPDRSFGCLNDDLYNHGPLSKRAYPPLASRPLEGGGCEYRLQMPKAKQLLWIAIVNDQEEMNDFWADLGTEMDFVWTTVDDVDLSDGTFWAQIELPVAAAPDLPIDPAIAYVDSLHEHMARDRREVTIGAFRAGVASAAPTEYEIDGQMMPADIAVEYLMGKLDRLRDGIQASLQPIRALVSDGQD